VLHSFSPRDSGNGNLRYQEGPKGNLVSLSGLKRVIPSMAGAGYLKSRFAKPNPDIRV
jgi:hypothetical protein